MDSFGFPLIPENGGDEDNAELLYRVLLSLSVRVVPRKLKRFSMSARR
jgi:hypothetical protein